MAARPAQERAEKALVEGLRALGRAFSRLADRVEAQRLTRAGYEQQDKYLERLDRTDQPGRRS